MGTLEKQIEAQTDAAARKLNEVEGAVRRRWDKLTDKDLRRVAGKSEKLVGVLQEKYGYTRQEASRMLDDLAHNLEDTKGELQDTARDAREWVKDRPYALVVMAALAALIAGLVFYFARLRTESEMSWSRPRSTIG